MQHTSKGINNRQQAILKDACGIARRPLAGQQPGSVDRARDDNAPEYPTIAAAPSAACLSSVPQTAIYTTQMQIGKKIPSDMEHVSLPAELDSLMVGLFKIRLFVVFARLSTIGKSSFTVGAAAWSCVLSMAPLVCPSLQRALSCRLPCLRGRLGCGRRAGRLRDRPG
jgi:hypothetical protein